MKARASLLYALSLALTLLFGCGRSDMGPLGSGDRVALECKGRKLLVEAACDPRSRQVGLMYRKELPEDEGMLFIFPGQERQRFWMRDTYIPLSIAFLDDRGKILEIRDLRPKDEAFTVSTQKVRYVLEVNQGWFRRNGIREGDVFERFPETVGRFQVR